MNLKKNHKINNKYYLYLLKAHNSVMKHKNTVIKNEIFNRQLQTPLLLNVLPGLKN